MSWQSAFLGELVSIGTGDKDVNQGSSDGKYPFFTCGKAIQRFDSFSFSGEAILIAGNGNFSVKKYSGEFEAYQRTYVIQDFKLNYLYLYYFLSHRLADITKDNRGSTVRYIRIGNLTGYSVMFPGPEEQHRIVGKIEALFAELDKGVADLKTTQQQLKVYRQSVLKHAFEGKLTEQWRKANPDKVGNAEDLLQRIQQERQQRYQQQISDWKQGVKAWEASAKDGRKPTKPKLQGEPEPLLKSELNKYKNLPANFALTQLGVAFNIFVGATPSRKQLEYWGEPNSWVSSGEVTFSRIQFTKEQITDAGLANTSTNVHPVGTVMLAMIGEGKTRGQAGILDIPAAHNQNTAAIRVSETNCLPEYVYEFLCYKYQETRLIGSGNNQKALNKSRVASMAIPICSSAEQAQIIQEIESRLSLVDQLGKTIEQSLQKSEALRQSILKKAFAGELVPQDH